jgi:hypothetical protein
MRSSGARASARLKDSAGYQLGNVIKPQLVPDFVQGAILYPTVN